MAISESAIASPTTDRPSGALSGSFVCLFCLAAQDSIFLYAPFETSSAFTDFDYVSDVGVH